MQHTKQQNKRLVWCSNDWFRRQGHRVRPGLRSVIVAATLAGDCLTQSERDGTNADFLLLLLPSGIRTAHFGALIAACYCTGLNSVPYLICKCGVLQGCWLISARAQRWSVYALSGLRACVAIVEIGSRNSVFSPSDNRWAPIKPNT